MKHEIIIVFDEPFFYLLYVKTEIFSICYVCMYKSTGIPKLVNKYFIIFNRFFSEFEIISCSIPYRERKPKRVSTMSFYHFKRIYTISKAFTHLSSLFVFDKSMEIYLFKWSFSCKFVSEKKHSNNPEKEYIMTCFQHLS